MKKLYAGLLAIFLCGMVSMVQAMEQAVAQAMAQAAEMKMKIGAERTRSDADRLLGWALCLEIVEDGVTNGKGLRDLLTMFNSDAEAKEYADQLEQGLFIPGLVNLSQEVSERFMEKAYEVYLVKWGSCKSNKDRYYGIISGLQSVNNGGYIEGVYKARRSGKKVCSSEYDSFLESSSKGGSKTSLEGCEDLMERALLISVHVMSQLPKNLLEAFEYMEGFDGLTDEDRKMLSPLFGAIIGIDKNVPHNLARLLPSKKPRDRTALASRIVAFLKGIEPVERVKSIKQVERVEGTEQVEKVEKKEKSFLYKIVNRKITILAVLGLGALLCYHFKLWRVFWIA